MMIIKLIFLLLIIVDINAALNVLVFLIGTTHYERANMEYLAVQLAMRNHHTITVKPILIPEEPRLVKHRLNMVYEKTINNLLPKNLYEPLAEIGDRIPWMNTYNLEETALPYYIAHNHSCYKILNSDLMDNLKNENIDVAIVYSGNACLLAILHVLRIPFIYFDNEGFTDETKVASGTSINFDIPSSNCPLLPQTQGLAYRLWNSLCYIQEIIAQSGITPLAKLISIRYRYMDSSVKKMFAEDYEIKKRYLSFPDINQIKQMAQFYFINTDPLLEYQHSLPSNVIPIGGFHIDVPKPLFMPWNTSVESAKDGVILVSLGTKANSSCMTSHQAKSILSALSIFTNFQIFWKIDQSLFLPEIDLELVPQHINITSFIPQIDLLANKRTRLFITNGGINSIMEAMTFGVPILGIPLFAMDLYNLEKVVHKGFGVVIEKSRLNNETLEQAISEILSNSRYRNTAIELSKIIKSRKASSLDVTLQYIEITGRYMAGKYLKQPFQRFYYIKSLNIDIFFTLILFILLPLLIIRCMRQLVLRYSVKKIDRKG